MRRLVHLCIILSLLVGAPATPSTAATATDTAPGLRAARSALASETSFVTRHRRSLLWITGSTAAGAGTYALFTRRRANDRFEDYERAADPNRIVELYDEVARLDDRAAAAFVVAEVAFVATMVLAFFISDPAEVGAPGASWTAQPVARPDLVGVGVRWTR